MKLCIIGPGYVGLTTGACFAEMGNEVRLVGRRREQVEALSRGEIPIYEPFLEEIVKRTVGNGHLRFTTALAEALPGARIVFLCVGTPMGRDGKADLSAVYEAARQIGEIMTEPVIVATKSTVPMGTSEEIERIIREAQALRSVSIPFTTASNPEFLKEGDAVNDFMKPDRVVVGVDEQAAAETFRELYAPFARSRDKLMVMDRRSSEMTKYAANCMLATKISFINEIANICERIGADVRNVRKGIAADPRIGPHFIYPGPGYGGSCFPKDVQALINTAKTAGFEPELLEAVERVNYRQKSLVAGKIERFFSAGGGVFGKVIAVWGLAFKPNTDDVRESPALTLVRELAGNGARIRAFDPAAMEKTKQALGDLPNIEYVADRLSAVQGAHALALMTEWNEFRSPDFDAIRERMENPAVFDGRNMYDPDQLRGKGFSYFGVGLGREAFGRAG